METTNATKAGHTPATWKFDSEFNQVQASKGETIVLSFGKAATKEDKLLIASAPELKAENEELKKSYQFVRSESNAIIYGQAEKIKRIENLNAELLEALKMVMSSIHEYGSFSNSEEFFNCKNKAKQAIAKAEGKE